MRVKLFRLVMNSWACWLNHPELHLLPVPWMCSCFSLYRMKPGCLHRVCPWMWVDVSSCGSAYASCLLSWCTHALPLGTALLPSLSELLHVPIQHTCIVLLVCTHFLKTLLIFVRLHMNSWIKCFQHLELDFLKEFHDICAQQGMFTAGIVNGDPHVETRTHQFSSVQFSRSVVSGSLRLHESSMPGLPVHYHLPEFTQTHVHRVRDAMQPSQ